MSLLERDQNSQGAHDMAPFDPSEPLKPLPAQADDLWVTRPVRVHGALTLLYVKIKLAIILKHVQETLHVDDCAWLLPTMTTKRVEICLTTPS